MKKMFTAATLGFASAISVVSAQGSFPLYPVYDHKKGLVSVKLRPTGTLFIVR